MNYAHPSYNLNGLVMETPRCRWMRLGKELMTQVLKDYRVLIVRAWSVQPAQNEEPVWRYTIEVPHTGERFGFISMQSLLEALDRKLLTTESATD